MFYKIKRIKPLENYKIKITFENEEKKIYDAKYLALKFSDLKNEVFFKNAKVDKGGYGISWSDDIDISSESLYYIGKNIKKELI